MEALVVTEICTRRAGGITTALSSCRSAITWPGPAARRPEDRGPGPSGRRRALAVALGCLPGGTSVTVWDVNGREWFITPARATPVAELRMAA
jgi:hypothetical protein